jgi:hypothetical protein
MLHGACPFDREQVEHELAPRGRRPLFAPLSRSSAQSTPSQAALRMVSAIPPEIFAALPALVPMTAVSAQSAVRDRAMTSGALARLS